MAEKNLTEHWTDEMREFAIRAYQDSFRYPNVLKIRIMVNELQGRYGEINGEEFYQAIDDAGIARRLGHTGPKLRLSDNRVFGLHNMPYIPGHQEGDTYTNSITGQHGIVRDIHPPNKKQGTPGSMGVCF